MTNTKNDLIELMTNALDKIESTTTKGFFITDQYDVRIGMNREKDTYGFDVRSDIDTCHFVQRRHAEFIKNRLDGKFDGIELRVVSAAEWKDRSIATIRNSIELAEQIPA